MELGVLSLLNLHLQVKLLNDKSDVPLPYPYDVITALNKFFRGV